MEMLSIGEVARRAGLRPSAIRFYESAGLLPPPPRSGGRRRFARTVIDRLAVIRAARDVGFSLDEIRLLLDGFPDGTTPPERWRALAAGKLPEVENAIHRATALKRLLNEGMACRCVRIEDCFLEDCSGQVQETRSLPIVAALPPRPR